MPKMQPKKWWVLKEEIQRKSKKKKKFVGLVFTHVYLSKRKKNGDIEVVLERDYSKIPKNIDRERVSVCLYQCWCSSYLPWNSNGGNHQVDDDEKKKMILKRS